MTPRSPPWLATWLLEELGRSVWRKNLIGDLSEQFAAGRSRSWYWRQASGALLLDLRQTLRMHGPSFLTAVSAGCALTCVWLFVNGLVFGALYQSLDARPHPDSLMRFLGLRAAQASTTIMVFVTVWTVTRMHRAHPRAVLLTFTIVLVAPRLPHIARLAFDATDGAPFRAILVPQIVRTALQAVFSLLIGLWVIKRERFAEMPFSTRFLAVLTVVLTLVSALLYDLRQVGVISYPLLERSAVEAAEIGCATYLMTLLWRRESRFTPAKSVAGRAASGPPA